MLRVVELAGPGDSLATAYAGWLLAGLGADVVRLDAGGDWLRPAGEDGPVGPLGLAREALTRGKRALPPPGTPDAFATLLDGCDVLLTDDPAGLAAIGIDVHDADRLLARHPRLVLGVATTFGLDGPYAGVPAIELDAQALSAVSWSLGEPGRAPLSLPPGIASHQTGAMLAAGVLAGLASRDATGRGCIVDVALADVLASYVAGNCRLYIHHGLKWMRSGRRASGSGGAYPYVILPCRDGAVCLCGRTREEWQRFVGAMGNPAWAFEPRYKSLRAMGTQYPDEVDARVMPWLAERTKAELEAIALEHNLIVSPVRSFAEVLATPQFAERGFLRDETIGGKHVRAPGLPFRVVSKRRAEAPDFAASLLAEGGDTAPALPDAVRAAPAPVDRRDEPD